MSKCNVGTSGLEAAKPFSTACLFGVPQFSLSTNTHVDDCFPFQPEARCVYFGEVNSPPAKLQPEAKRLI